MKSNLSLIVWKLFVGDQYGANAKVCDTIAIAPRWVLSTASCFKDQNPAAVQSYQVERYVQHPSFSSVLNIYIKKKQSSIISIHVLQ